VGSESCHFVASELNLLQEAATAYPSIHITCHTLITVISAVTTGLCCLISLIITIGHLKSWVNSQQQRQIVRIIWFPPVFAIFNLFSIIFYKAQGHLNPIPQLYEAFAIPALFLLSVAYVAPGEATRDSFFNELELRRRSGNTQPGKGSLQWFRVSVNKSIIVCAVA
jgi:hypothetical protein